MDSGVCRIEYVGHQLMTIWYDETKFNISIDLLLKFESEAPIEDIITTNALMIQREQIPFDWFVKNIRKIMSTCNCYEVFQCNNGYCGAENLSIRDKYMYVFEIPLTNHHEWNHRKWRECLAVKVFDYCCLHYKNQIEQLFPNEDESPYTNCTDVIRELFVLSKLGYPRALQIVMKNFQVQILCRG